ncbi:MAG: type I restriction enzyme EcoKI subunit R [Methanosaeta sp. PtaB.Bin039]|nr:MAG: type I restriction enzyme EcoKI subunit R [Methanosaeta sp. PtaB.Bin039]
MALTITSRIPNASSLAKDFRDSKRSERVAVSVDMLSTGYNCRDLLNVVLMRPIFSPTEYIQIKGRGTRRFIFTIGNTEYEKKHFFLLDFCAVAEYFEEKYDYSAPLRLLSKNRRRSESSPYEPTASNADSPSAADGNEYKRREIPIWEGTDRIIRQEIRVVGLNGEKVDIMTFRGSFERDLEEFAEINPDLKEAVEAEDDDAIEIILQERFYHHPEMFYAPDKLIIAYGVPAPTSAFVYNALGKRTLPTKDQIIIDTVDSIAARFNLRYVEQKWINATAELVSEDAKALKDFLAGHYSELFKRSQFRTLGGLDALIHFDEREEAFEALRQSSLIQCTRMAMSEVS